MIETYDGTTPIITPPDEVVHFVGGFVFLKHGAEVEVANKRKGPEKPFHLVGGSHPIGAGLDCLPVSTIPGKLVESRQGIIGSVHEKTEKLLERFAD